jgi:ketosteroid isomerase-like protein
MSDPGESPSDRVTLAEAGIDAFRRGDTGTVLALFDEEIEIHAPLGLGNVGTYRGHAGYMEWLENWLEAWEGFDIVSLERIEEVGSHHVVAAAYQTARGRGSGVPVEQRIAYMWEIRDDKVVAMHLYPTWEEAVAVARRREDENGE